MTFPLTATTHRAVLATRPIGWNHSPLQYLDLLMSADAGDGGEGGGGGSDGKGDGAGTGDNGGGSGDGGNAGFLSGSADDGGGGEGGEQGSTGGGEAPQGDKLSIEYPEGLVLDDAAKEAFSKVAKDLKLSSEQATGLAKFEAERLAAYAEADAEAYKQQQSAWDKEIREHPQYGKANYQKSQAEARKAIERFAPAGFAQALQDLGLASWPPLAILLTEVGRAVGEDSSSSRGGASNDPRARKQAQLRDTYHTHYNEDGSRKTQ